MESAFKINDTSQNGKVVKLFTDCLRFVVSEYYRFKKIFKLIEGMKGAGDILTYRPSPPVLENMLRDIYLNIDSSLSGNQVYGIDDMEWKNKEHKGWYFWKHWGIELRLITFRMLLLWGFLIHRDIASTVISPKSRTPTGKLMRIFNRFYK